MKHFYLEISISQEIIFLVEFFRSAADLSIIYNCKTKRLCNQVPLDPQNRSRIRIEFRGFVSWQATKFRLHWQNSTKTPTFQCIEMHQQRKPPSFLEHFASCCCCGAEKRLLPSHRVRGAPLCGAKRAPAFLAEQLRWILSGKLKFKLSLQTRINGAASLYSRGYRSTLVTGESLALGQNI